ncbi:MAG: hypothetical protein ABJH28_05155 [Paraglaciecola sp.]|uniref:hypothetical protein n=1 Tax=Paraglaciecola sp. TaxID=1920173 RepID=UPI0032638156
MEALRAARPFQNAELHYTPDDMTVISVHSCIEAERIGKLNKDDRIMQLSHEKFKTDLAKVRQEGFDRAQFNQASHTHALTP